MRLNSIYYFDTLIDYTLISNEMYPPKGTYLSLPASVFFGEYITAYSLLMLILLSVKE